MPPGRPRCHRRVESEPTVSFFKPQGVPLRELEMITLSVEELEVVRLLDLEGLDQEQAAERLGISRRTLWDDLQNARRKIIDALVKGKAIEIKGGHYQLVTKRTFSCHDCHHVWNEPYGQERPKICPNCQGARVFRCADDGTPEKPSHGHRCRGEHFRCSPTQERTE